LKSAEIFDQADSRNTFFAELLLPVPIPKLFTYRVPFAFNELIKVGQRVIVQFGDRKILTAIVIRIHETPPKEYEAKYILEILDAYASVSDLQLKFFEWMADYYMCTLGEVMNAALPAGLKLSSESMVQLHPAFSLEESDHAFSEKELMLLRRLENDSMSYSDISKFLGAKSIYTILKTLSGKNAIVLYEEVKEKFKPKTEKRIRLTNDFNRENALQKLFETLATKPKQEAIVLKFLQEVPILQDSTKNKPGISKKELLTDELSESSLNTLIKNQVFEEFEQVIPRFEFEEAKTPVLLLSEDQEKAQAEIFKTFEKHNITLLHGITGSGKTEIYVNLIKKALESDSQVLYLLPEIALTTQIVQRLKKVFGSTMGVYHSKFSDNERVEVWNGVLNGQLKFVVGVRSSVFLPFDNLGLIIVDEEHDASYKQQEPTPRYHARDSSLILAQFHHAKVLLGSATPSVESFFHAVTDKYGLVTLDKRFGEAQLPTMVLADMTQERRNKTVKGEFSGLLLKQIEETLSRKEQVIIFQNRRGYSPMVHCEDCGWIPKCVNCAVSLTYHQYKHAMVCHYCGYRESLPTKCPTCTSTRITTVGYGTEKLEEELNLYFPEAHVMRMDLDTTRSKTGYESIIEKFESGETDILVGTQMVTKGLDFDNVSLVGVFNADRMMHFPDFRSYERAYQLITQVSGRSGRRKTQGKVIIQTTHPEHPILHNILAHQYRDFFEGQIADRRQHDFPPFTRLIEITVKHIDKKVCRDTAVTLAEKLRQKMQGVKILGPGEPMISKIRNQFLMTILIKMFRGKGDLAMNKATIHECVDVVQKEKIFRNSRIALDVDPV
jgi:primosomal protein N' (replication factor Y) (superfamily II helicase)